MAKQIKIGAYTYVEEIVEEVESAMQDTIEQANSHYFKFETYVTQQIDVMKGNREELKVSRERTEEVD